MEKPDRPARPPPSLRRTLALALIVLTTTSGAASAALVLVTRELYARNASLAADTERHERTQSALRDYLVSEHASSAPVRDALTRDMMSKLEAVEAAPSSADEQAAVRRALDVVRLRSSADAAEPRGDDDAADAIDALVRVQSAHLAERRRDADRIHAAAHVIGVVNAALVLFASIALLLALDRKVVRPLSRLASRIDAFGRGDLATRATEEGPREMRDMARAFNAMAACIVEQDATQRTYLAGIAHDLRNPLNVLRGAVSLEPELVREESQVRRVLGMVQRQLGQIERLVGDVEDVESMRAGDLKLDLAVHDLRALVTAVADLFRTASRRHRIVLRMPDRPVPLACDGVRIQQVLTNVVGNAIKYSPQGGEVTIDVRSGAGRVSIAVTDRGIGMTEEQVAAAFGAFSRGTEVRDHIPGKGLGLFIASRIVDDHGGSIDVSSVPGEGTTLRVDLPTDLSDELGSSERMASGHR